MRQSHHYDGRVADHYAAYRPPLHSLILQRALSSAETFDTGIDIGAGTGYSSVALASYCDRVFAIEPGGDMLARAAAHDKVHYIRGTAEMLPFPDGSVAIATFAGSLSYVDRTAVVGELLRVGRAGTTVIAYDFDVPLEGVVRHPRLQTDALPAEYDHGANLSGRAGLDVERLGHGSTTLQVTSAELAHLLLADSGRFGQLSSRLETADPYPAVLEMLRESGNHCLLRAEIFYTRHRIR
jgi:SAM-dependent methyltransferase